ncbi:zinc finger MYM-type protein 1-like [Tachypleus tridentatus]|uniref:zinc finger MYM-type protein 1-like n=1 Tax=Tachypleus tridentatus TaxID=6853 RepID=UPI003FD2F96E
MQRYLLPKKRQQVDGPTNTCGASEEDSGDRDGPKDLSQLPDSGPTCPYLKRYPATEYSGQSRSFNKKWRDQHSWLEYSVTQDVAFCFACRIFIHTHFSKTEKSFTLEGFRNWKKATTSLKSHDNSTGHKFAMQAWAEFKLQKTKACQNEAQRGHREDSQSDNRVNFLELLNMIFRYDEIVKKKLSGPGNAKYTHHDIQNELLDIIAEMIRKDIS